MTWRPPLAVAALLLSSCGEPPMPTISEEQAASADYWFIRVAANAGRPFHGRFEVHIDERAAILGEAWIQDPRHFSLTWEQPYTDYDELYGQYMSIFRIVHGDGGEWAQMEDIASKFIQMTSLGLIQIVQHFAADPVAALAPPLLEFREGASLDFCKEIAALGAGGEYEVVSFDGQRAILERPFRAREQGVEDEIQVLRIGVDARSGFPVLIERSYGSETGGRLQLEWTRHRFAREFPQNWFDAPEVVDDPFQYQDLRPMTRREWYAKKAADAEEEVDD